jgi:large subunit ribosomal protein L17e
MISHCGNLAYQGNVGATEGGLPFLEEEEIIPVILQIAEQSPIPSVRG